MSAWRVVRVVLTFARWAWSNRRGAAVYELTVIRRGQEADDYLRMLCRAQQRFVEVARAHPPVGSTPAPLDLDAAWSEMQRRERAGE